MSTDAGIACVSCHPGGGDDSHTWRFIGLGPRRTQSLEGGISERAPFHWDGEFEEIGNLMSDVFVGRMGATVMPSASELGHFVSWLDGIRASTPVPEKNAASVARGASLFADREVGCATCHSGPTYSDGKLHDVGTGLALITPHLTGIATRAPFMHDGCAADLKARFGICGGGDAHGVTSGLNRDQIDDLVAFLNTL
jgi:mono/diheme cytochrome c family protein